MHRNLLLYINISIHLHLSVREESIWRDLRNLHLLLVILSLLLLGVGHVSHLRLLRELLKQILRRWLLLLLSWFVHTRGCLLFHLIFGYFRIIMF